jgi:hypothetical protein
MQNVLIAFLAGMAVMYLLTAMPRKQLRRRVGRHWETIQENYRRQRKKRRHR